MATVVSLKGIETVAFDPVVNSYMKLKLPQGAYITPQLLFCGASPGFCDFSICAIMSSNALATLLSYAALASVHPHLNFSDNLRPSSRLTCRCSGRKSLLFPTITIGTDSVPCTQKGG